MPRGIHNNHKKNSGSFKKGVIPWSKSQKGIHLSPKSEFKKGMTPWNKGKNHNKIKGDKNPNWRGGTRTIRKQIRDLLEYFLWKKQVFERDNYTCQMCGQRGGKLHVDHITPITIIITINDITAIEQALACKELWDITNGRTLCVKCHRQTETYGMKYWQWIEGNKYVKS